jgi:hypothetical protein
MFAVLSMKSVFVAENDAVDVLELAPLVHCVCEYILKGAE